MREVDERRDIDGRVVPRIPLQVRGRRRRHQEGVEGRHALNPRPWALHPGADSHVEPKGTRDELLRELPFEVQLVIPNGLSQEIVG